MSLPKEETPLFKSNVYISPNVSSSSLPAVAILLQSFLEEKCREELQGYIWQREAPKVKVDLSQKDLFRLNVTMRHGGSVEDEWLAVHLLLLATSDSRFSGKELVKKLEGKRDDVISTQYDGLVIDISDEDGQFLLIEAADRLPPWVQPDNADGRLWLCNGQFHLITPETHKGDLIPSNDDSNLMKVEGVSAISPQLAVPIIRSQNTNTQASFSFTDAIITQRLPSYPDLTWALYNQHSTLAYLPRKAAVALHKSPQLIADAAEAFEGREGPSDARRLREMKVFGLASKAASEEASKGTNSDTILVKVKLPRRLYASFTVPRYLPPKAFGDDWRQAVSTYWEVLEKASRGENVEVRIDERNNGRRRDLGCKIACGLELTYGNAKERGRGKQSDLFSSASDAELRSSTRYAPFIQSLERIGFFGSNIRDSKEWKVREREALDLWRRSQTTSADDEHTSDNLQQLIDIDLTTASSPPHYSATTSLRKLDLEEDPDAFMHDLPDQMKDAADNDDTRNGNDAETEDEKVAMGQVNAFADKLQSFVDGKGDVDGALFDDEEAESDDDEEVTEEERAEAMRNLVPSMPEEEWGAKDEKLLEANKEADTVASAEKVSTKGFSRKVRYDGASDSEESVDDEILRAGDTDEDRRSRARWLDMEAELDEDEEERRKMAADEKNADRDDVDFGQDEMLDFIEFTRKELGLSEEQYEDILSKRREKGAYVPPSKTTIRHQNGKQPEIQDPFERLMNAMDGELVNFKGQQNDAMEEPIEEDEDDEMDLDALSPEDAELLEKMLHNGPPASLRVLLEKNDKGSLSSVEKEVMQSMLASYSAQMGGAGPVGALAGRLGIGPLPVNSD